MSISDRLDEIEARIIRAREGRHTDRYMVLDVDAPEMLAALRAVLDRHKPVVECGNPRHTNFDIGCPECLEVCAHGCEGPWPCPTFLAIEAALGEGHSNA